MIIQPNSPPINQAAQPDRVSAPSPVRAVAVAAPPPPPPAAPQPASVEELKGVVAMINQAMRQSNRALEFSVDSDADRTVVRMVDTSTGELIRQFPTEATLAISRSIDQFQQGLLLKQQA